MTRKEIYDYIDENYCILEKIVGACVRDAGNRGIFLTKDAEEEVKSLFFTKYIWQGLSHYKKYDNATLETYIRGITENTIRSVLQPKNANGRGRKRNHYRLDECPILIDDIENTAVASDSVDDPVPKCLTPLEQKFCNLVLDGEKRVTALRKIKIPPEKHKEFKRRLKEHLRNLEIEASDDWMKMKPPKYPGIPETLSPKEKEFCRLRNAGKTKTEIYKILDISRSRISRFLKRLEAHLHDPPEIPADDEWLLHRSTFGVRKRRIDEHIKDAGDFIK